MRIRGLAGPDSDYCGPGHCSGWVDYRGDTGWPGRLASQTRLDLAANGPAQGRISGNFSRAGAVYTIVVTPLDFTGKSRSERRQATPAWCSLADGPDWKALTRAVVR